MACGESLDVVDGVMMKAGEVVYKGKDYELSVLEKGLRLVSCSASKSADRVPILDLSWRDIVCACEVHKKKSKMASKGSNAFVVYYIVKDPKTKKCHCQSDQLEAKEESADTWIALIEKMRKEGKPKKLLVIINPIGGKMTARKDFEKISQPLFSLAGIETVVKISERAQHAREIAKDFDTSTVDGVVVVGGDGLYMEVLHTLVLKAQEEAGIDVNDPGAQLVSPSFNFGIIPGGTGNGVTGWLNGVKDFQTATLNIIRGETNGTGIFSVHEPGKLIHYCGILLGYGLFADMMETLDDLRWMKKARIAYVGLKKLFGKKRVYDLDVEVLRDQPSEKSTEHSDAEAAKSLAGWTKLGVKHVTAMLVLLAHFDMEAEDRAQKVDPFSDVFHVSFISTHSGFDYVKLLYEYSLWKKDAYTHDYVEMVNKIKALRFRLVEDEKKEDSASRGNSGRRDVSRYLDVDGETMTCTVPNIEIRLHPYLIQAYSVKEKH